MATRNSPQTCSELDTFKRSQPCCSKGDFHSYLFDSSYEGYRCVSTKRCSGAESWSWYCARRRQTLSIYIAIRACFEVRIDPTYMYRDYETQRTEKQQEVRTRCNVQPTFKIVLLHNVCGIGVSRTSKLHIRRGRDSPSDPPNPERNETKISKQTPHARNAASKRYRL